jgi:flagellin
MSFTIATNVAALNAHTNSAITQRSLSASLEKLSSGYKINKAADDASGMAIADSLRTQAKSLGQAIRNANDAIGIIQIADKGMDEQIKILDTIKVKAIQSAQDGQTAVTRSALQADITRLMEELDNIASTTTFNGKSLLAGGYSNAKFQIGAYSNTTINASIGATSSDKIGQTRFETGKNITSDGVAKLTFKAVNGRDDITLESVIISHTAGTGLGALSEAINKNSNELQVRASWKVESTGSRPAGESPTGQSEIKELEINGVHLGTINAIKINDSDGKIVASFNNLTDQTGVKANIDARGHLQLTSVDGRGITISAKEGLGLLGLEETSQNRHSNYGRLTFVRNDAKDIIVEEEGTPGFASTIGFGDGEFAETIINLRSARGSLNKDQASAIGAHTNRNSLVYTQTSERDANNVSIGRLSAGVTTFNGAQTVMDIADTAIKNLDKIRSDLGSVQIQLESTINNISTTQINIKYSESIIRDTDFGSETSNFKKGTILAQAGSYAIAQASAMQQNVQRLLQ